MAVFSNLAYLTCTPSNEVYECLQGAFFKRNHCVPIAMKTSNYQYKLFF